MQYSTAQAAVRCGAAPVRCQCGTMGPVLPDPLAFVDPLDVLTYTVDLVDLMDLVDLLDPPRLDDPRLLEDTTAITETKIELQRLS
nr:hypothetical protein BaRGS_024418 [Batillaria attramentaria]